jgi:hypothetical protein
MEIRREKRGEKWTEEKSKGTIKRNAEDEINGGKNEGRIERKTEKKEN